MSNLEDDMRQLAHKFRTFSKDLRDKPAFGKNDGLDSYEQRLIAGIWDEAAQYIDDTIKDHNRWHQEPT